MIVKFISFFILIAASYTVVVFVTPEFADTYGSVELNTKIRTLKDMSLNYASGSETPSSLADRVLDTGKSLIDETRETADQIQLTIDTKTEQAKKATESAQKAYDATLKAREDFRNLTNFSGSVQVGASGSIQ